VFGPFKRFYYSECASYMKANPGKVVTKYEVGGIACSAYLKALSPWNIVSAFRKAGVYPLNKNAVPSEKLMPCESFRDSTPLQKIKAVRAGKQAVDDYLQSKSEAPTTNTSCKCQKKMTTNPKSKPGGKMITSDAYIQEVETYDAQKKRTDAVPPQNRLVITSPRPSTSGLQVTHVQLFRDADSESESDTDDTETCCVCNKFSPANLDLKPHIKIVNWGQCDECGHWVHLSFCHTKSVLRRGDSFLCPHCC